MQINPLQTSQENLLALFNAKNTSGIPFDASNVALGVSSAFSINLSPSNAKLVTNPGTGVITVTGGNGEDGSPLWHTATVTVDETNSEAKTIVFQLESSTEQAALDFQKWFVHHSTTYLVGGNIILAMSNQQVTYTGLNGSGRYAVQGSANFVVTSQLLSGGGEHVGSLATHPSLADGQYIFPGISANKVNTKLTIAATANAGFSGSRDVYYNRNRLALSTAFDYVNDYIDVPTDATDAQVLDAIADQAGLVRDALNSPYASVTRPVAVTASTPGTFRIQTSTSNPLYRPGAGSIITFNIRYPQQDLNTAVADNEMDGFNAVV